MKKHFIDFLLYRWRYVLGYGVLIGLLITAIIIASLYSPGGLSHSEITFIAPISQLSGDALAIPNLPLRILQTSIFSLFGVSIFTIKLPSIILAVLTAVAVFFLLRRWFKPNVAILSMLITVATGQYLFIAQSATADILYVLYSALILLFASLILQKAKHSILWKISLAASLALSLYTPYFIYINIGLCIVALIHPHTRYHLLRKSQRINWLISAAVFGILIAPLIYFCVTHPSLIQELIGLTAFANIDIIAGLKTLLFSYFWISPIVSNGQIIPILDFGALAIIILGILVLFRQVHTARTFMIVAWIIFTVPLFVIDPTLTTVMTMPLLILLSIGLETLLYEWYRLFPKNPYARGTGLVLIVTLVGVIIASGIDLFTNGYRFMPAAAREFQSDITLVKQQIHTKPVRTLLLVSNDELALYQALVKYTYPHLDIQVSTSPKGDIPGNVIVTRQQLPAVPTTGWTLQRIITSDHYESGNRLYLYKAGEDAV